MQGDARRRGTRTPTVTLSTIGYQLSAIDHRLSAIGYRLSAIDHRLSAIDYRLSAIECKTRLCVTRTPTATLSTIGYRLSVIGYRLSALRGKVPLCITRTPTPTVTLSTIGYRLRSALGYPGRSPPARHANSNGDPLDHRLSAIGYRLSITRLHAEEAPERAGTRTVPSTPGTSHE